LLFSLGNVLDENAKTFKVLMGFLPKSTSWQVSGCFQLHINVKTWIYSRAYFIISNRQATL